ncbi:MAG TPA: 50S ribosomal protein L4 [Patescibacteria group bacterium]|nr:50S ribosomal protein L4 [Patescibacteria group bacterium]
MKVSVLNMVGNKVGEVELAPSVFEANISRELMHQALVRQLANARRGTHKAKSRSEINRTTKKWYRQKGTGRARHGSRRAPIFVGGGVAHGPKPRSYQKDMPRKMRRAAIRSALSAKASAGDIVVLDQLEMERPKTKDMVEVLGRLTGVDSTLVLVADRNENVEKSARNLTNVKALRANYLNIRDILGHQKIVVPISALELIQGFLGQGDAIPMVTAVVSTGITTEEEE